MRLLIVRHAIAEDRDEFAATGQDDRLRPLTATGARKMKRAADGLRTLVASIDLVAASPLVRAAETAEIIRDAYGLAEVLTEPSLVPEGSVASVAAWVATRTENTVAVVGHEPQVSRLVAFLIGAGDRGVVEMKKGAVCLIELDQAVHGGGGRLIWALAPRVLRGLSG